ncbi:MAG: DNA mismatch repair endonuclease MutL [Myxococcales bacterium]|nr:DNA mismatch repair endonuclease MutL [Myxococcales bacterium]
MGNVRILPPELANQIAAGEVVERPSSAVKELLENALDAGARRCQVEIEAGGVGLIRVSDDGSGMSDDDAKLALERHATSKIGSLAELGHVRTFGFRGEALPSIASVSRFALTTRARESDAGVELVVEAGAPPTARPAGTPVGTTVAIRDLFYNVPARRKFLRATGTEAGHVTDVVESAALARPDVSFTLVRDGRPVREWLHVTTRAERVAQVLGDSELARCTGERGPLSVEAFLGRPETARAGAGGLRLFVNDRPVRDRALALAVARAYGSVLERGRYPRGVVYLDIDPALVDVNVHPQKAEVRFADPRAVNDALYSILSRELSSAFSIPPARRWNPARVAPPPPPPAPPEPAAPAAEPADPWGLAATAPDPPAASYSKPEEPLVAVQDAARAPIRPRPEMRWANLRFVAQVRHTFLVCEADDGLYVLDQHAAAERVTFDKLRKAYRSSAVSSQALLFPVMMEVTGAEADLVATRGEEIAAVGLDLRVRGPETLSIHAVPKLLQKASPERLVRDLLSEVLRGGGRGFSDAVDLALATMACHASIRAGDPLSAGEATALLRALDEADFAGHCPHGRPVVTFTGWNELDRRVGRR